MALTPEKIWQNECLQKEDCILYFPFLLIMILSLKKRTEIEDKIANKNNITMS